MRPEDELDARLSAPTPAARASAELAPLLAAAARLAPLRDAMPDHAFADDLEARLLAHVGQRPAATPPVTQRRTLRFPPRIAWAAVAAVLLVTVGLGALTAQAAPGAPLYGVRELAQTLAGRTAASPTSGPYAALARAQADLAAFDAASASQDTSAALVALARLRADDATAAHDAATLSDADARQTAQAQIAAFHERAASDLRASLAWLAWRPRAQVTDILRAWGDVTLTVNEIDIRAGGPGGQPAVTANNGDMLIVEARGAGFVKGALLLVNGAPVGQTISLSATHAVFQVPASALNLQQPDDLTLAIENPDGAVAIARQTQQGDHGAAGQVSTPGAGNHNGDHGGSNTTPNASATTNPDNTGGSSGAPGH